MPIDPPRAALFCAVALVLSGCSRYELSGRVIEGDVSFVSIVDVTDERLSYPGVPGVELRVVLDPQELNSKLAGQAMSAGDGGFQVPIDAIGAGMLEYDISIEARRKGYQSAESFMPMPSGNKRILVVLSRGKDAGRFDDTGFDSLYDEYEYYRDRNR